VLVAFCGLVVHRFQGGRCFDVRLLMSVPADPDGITPDWLTTALRDVGAVSHAQVMSIQSGPVGHMGMTGQLYRLQISYDGAEPGAPSSLLAKFSALDPEVRATVNSIGFYEREIGFYREFAADCPVRTPRCYFGEVEMNSVVSLLLLEDLTWMRNLDSIGGDVDEVELVIRELGKLHAAWWGDARLDQTPWLPMKGILTPDQAQVVLIQNWESFLGKLSIPVTDEILAAGGLCARYLSAVYISMYTQPPRTLIHHDVQGDNLLVAGDGEPSLALVDWQLTTAARPVLDLAGFLVAHLETSERRRHEDRLLEIYHSVLTERGVADYSLEQCREDYGMALLIPASRLATAVGLHPGLTATPDGFWNVAFPRYARALTDLGISELLQQHYG
jgi:hypothetical protein